METNTLIIIADILLAYSPIRPVPFVPGGESASTVDLSDCREKIDLSSSEYATQSLFHRFTCTYYPAAPNSRAAKLCHRIESTNDGHCSKAFTYFDDNTDPKESNPSTPNKP